MHTRSLKFVSVALLVLVGCGDSGGGGGGDDGGTTDVDSNVPDCVPETGRCTDLVPETCSAEGRWVAGTACDFVCAAGTCAGECTPGATRCTDLVPESCDSTGAWVAAAACEFVCLDGACTGSCDPGTRSCDGAQPQLCNSLGVLEDDGAVCDYVCTAGSCTGACVPGTTRCEGLSPQECSAEGTFEALSADCAFVCADAACTGSCVPGTKRCGAGGTVETCDATGTFATTETCAQECSAGACVCDEDHEGDGYDCTPLDFCAPTRGGCAPHATCSQSGTVPSCVCEPNYTGDGLACTNAITTQVSESFDDVSTLTARGWLIHNSSSPVGPDTWFQGRPTPTGPFDAFEGATNAYVGVNYNSTGNTGTISNWLISPEIDFGDAAAFSFATRKSFPDSYSDRLEIRICTALPCDAPGAGPDTITKFETVLRSINPTEALGVYPTSWTEFTLTNADGIPRSGRGRIAFRYFVTGAGLLGVRSDYIGIDTVRYSVGAPAYPVGGAIAFVGAPFAATISLNHLTEVSIAADGAFTFPMRLNPGTPYVITTRHVPAGSSCVVTNGTGTVAAGVSNVQVECTTAP